MMNWPDRRALELLGIELPILLAPMAGPGTPEMAIAVSRAGGLGALACSQLSGAALARALDQIRVAESGPTNLNFFCHVPPNVDEARDLAWRASLRPFYLELALDPETTPSAAVRQPFNVQSCAVVEAWRPEVVSFHFGLPDRVLLARVKATGAKVIASATTVAEAVWLEARGCDAVVAQGLEAGGHRGCFLSDDPAGQVGTFALVPQVVDAVGVPVIAAGGIADGRGIAAAFALGACAVQIGTAYLFCPEARIGAAHLAALRASTDDATMLTNLFTGRPARGIANRLMRELGPISKAAPAFPLAAGALAPLRLKAEAEGSVDFTPLWSGQAAPLGQSLPAEALTLALAEGALARISNTHSQE